jgi:hypothetical protein
MKRFQTILPTPVVLRYDVRPDADKMGSEMSIVTECSAFREKPGQKIVTEIERGVISFPNRNINLLPKKFMLPIACLFVRLGGIGSSKLATTEQNAALGITSTKEADVIGGIACLACCNNMCSRSSSLN